MLLLPLALPLFLPLAAADADAFSQVGQPGPLGGRIYKQYEVFGQTDWGISKSRPAGDLNGDGCEDFLIGTIGIHRSGPLTQGRLQVHSGLDGSVLRTHLGAAVGDRFGFDYSTAGDLNGDGVAEYMVSAPSSDLYGIKRGVVYVYDGVTGTEIRNIGGRYDFGFIGGALAGGHDLTGDGVPDLAMLDDCDAGTPWSGGWRNPSAKVVKVYAGAKIGNQFYLPEYVVRFSRIDLFLEAVSDVNNDGCDELVIHWGDRMRFLSPKDGAVIWNASRVSYAFCEIDDVDGDGKSDFVLGNEGNGVTFADGSAHVFSTAGLVETLTVYGPAWASEHFGFSLANLGDINADGVSDFAVGSPNWNIASTTKYGRVRFFSGADGAVLAVMDAEKELDGFSQQLSSADVNGDGRRELLAGIDSRHHTVGGTLQLNTGVVFPIGFDPMIEMFPRTMSAAIGGRMQFDLDFDGGSMNYALLASGTGTGPTLRGAVLVPLDFDGLTSAMYYHPPPWFGSGTQGVTDGNGNARVDAYAAANELDPLAGRTVWFSALAFGGSAGNWIHWATTAQELVITP